jgi:hypothetical protein
MGRRLKASNPTKATPHKASEVEVRNIAHPKVWTLALTIAGGNAALLQVESFSKVWVTLP